MPDFTPYTQHQLNDTLKTIYNAIYTVVSQLEIAAWRTREPVPFEHLFNGEELQLAVGDKWGDFFDCAWFRFTGKVPASAAGQSVVLLLDVNGEMCVVDEQGTPVRGLTNVSSDFERSLGVPGKRVLSVTPHAQGGEPIEVWADAGCNDLYGNIKENGVIKEAFVAVLHEETRALYYDFEVLLDSLQVFPKASPRYQQILVALNDAKHELWSGMSDDTVRRARQILQKSLQKRGGDPSLQISAIGHAHLDLAWLWPIRETKRKGARTFATALANMELYSDYIFAASQAQLFQWMKESYPTLYQKIKQKVKEGRLEPQGALWVEPDINLPCGEALIRQILLGKRFFRTEFGLDIRYVWLPDTFGYSAALPQILKLAGIDYFSTQKLSWSLLNHFPHHSFHWQGIDGSSILVHMLAEETYNGSAAARSIGKIETNYQDKGISDRCLMAFGIGDGGGGPGEEHLERLTRLKNFAGLSPVKQEWTATFFEQWAQDANRFATWVGELYLERHQGTFTTSGRSKWYNRRIEQSLRELEWLAAMAGLTTEVTYPTERLAAIWKEVLLYQFHDILPGSSIKRVYDESLARYRVLLDEVEEKIQQQETTLTQQVNTDGMEQPWVVFNSLSWERTEWLKLGQTWRRVALPPMGYVTVDAAMPGDGFPMLTATPDCLENDCLCVRFDPNGAITSVFDKVTGREVIPPGEMANRLALYHDLGDAWDIPLDYAESEPKYLQLVSTTPQVDGPHAILAQVYRYGNSELVQKISLTAGSARLEFDTRVRWREIQTMLRALFPVAVFAEEATFEIQFGHVHRPTHSNTTWHLAQQEVPAHKWVDLSQRDYGVALLNDSKYGHKVKGHVIELNLIRSVPYPGPRLVQDEEVQPGEPHHAYTDQTDHVFRYALYPHPGDPVVGRVIQAGYEFNIPPRPVETQSHAGTEPPQKSMVQVDSSAVIVETIKKAEDTDDLIIRLYEAAKTETRVTVHFEFPVEMAEETNLLEEPLRNLKLNERSVELVFHPFEIKIIRVVKK